MSSQSDPFRGFYSLFWIGLCTFNSLSSTSHSRETVLAALFASSRPSLPPRRSSLSSRLAVLFALQTIIRYYQETGYVFSGAFLALISGNALELAISDAVLVGSSYLCVPFVRLIERGLVPYYWVGCGLQHAAQLLYLAITVIWVFNK